MLSSFQFASVRLLKELVAGITCERKLWVVATIPVVLSAEQPCEPR